MITQETSRHDRQRIVVEWGERAFGRKHMQDPIVRAARFLEEALELAQAAGLPIDHAQRVMAHVYGRNEGLQSQEVGGVCVTLMALCGALGLSAEFCEVAEINRCLSHPPEHFAKRNKEKIEQVDKNDP